MLIPIADKFPIDLDAAWIELRYSSKQNAKLKLIRVCVEGTDYVRCGVKRDELSKLGGAPREHIRLTKECFEKLRISKLTPQNAEREIANRLSRKEKGICQDQSLLEKSTF